ncbi:MAG TPA: HAD domain-containing protein [Catenuloplanes sp.]|jgi:hypothetical protein
MDRPVWLLDVDGVLNAARPGWRAPPRSDNAYSAGTMYRMRWAPALLDRIRGLHRADQVEIRWCTTWCSDADQVERVFALPRLDRCWFDDLTGAAAASAKLAAARDVLAAGRRLIWTDDAVVPTSGPVYDELTAAGRALLIAPSPRRGLQPEHLDAIEEFTTDPCATDTDAARAEALLVARRLLGGDTTAPP